MFGLLIVVAIYVILGFMLAWIVGIVAKEEISIGQGVLILVLTAIVSIAVDYGVASLALSEPLGSLAWIIANFAALTLFTKLVAHIDWKPSLGVAAIYTVILTGISMLFF